MSDKYCKGQMLRILSKLRIENNNYKSRYSVIADNMMIAFTDNEDIYRWAAKEGWIWP